jgi:drug/metabolite transporter (DMT)-like permease
MVSSIPHPARSSTLLGAVAILLWSTTVAFSRSLTEQLGTLTAGAAIYTAAGLFGIAAAGLRAGGLSHLHNQIRMLPRSYLAGCGGLFVLYITTFYLAIGSAETREQVLVVGLVNYPWPAFSLLFSIPILGNRARWHLPFGITIAVGGTALATFAGAGTGMPMLQQPANIAPYLLALTAAVSWGLYSNFSRRWAGAHDGGGVPYFLLASGALLAGLRPFFPESPQWNTQAILELAYMAIFPAMLAYALWDQAVRKGEIVLVASLSYLTPLLSTGISALFLGVQPGASVWAGAALVIAGALLCKTAVSEPGANR